MREKKRDNWIQTYCGFGVKIVDPDPGSIHIEDIAHSLSRILRYNGHAKFDYTVAQHSVLVSQLTSKDNALWGLMHDAAEYVIGDIASPVKWTVPGIKQVEDALLKSIVDALELDLPWPVPTEIKYWDRRLLVQEARVLMPDPPHLWAIDLPSSDIEFDVWDKDWAKRRFLQRYEELTT